MWPVEWINTNVLEWPWRSLLLFETRLTSVLREI